MTVLTGSEQKWIAQARTLAACQDSSQIVAWLNANGSRGSHSFAHAQGFAASADIIGTLLGIIERLSAPLPVKNEPVLRVEDDEKTLTDVDIRHSAIADPAYAYYVRLTVDAETTMYRRAWLTPDQADEVADNLHIKAAEARRLQAANAL